MRTCLITGASGFVGRHLAKGLQEAPLPWQLRLVSRNTDRLIGGIGTTHHAVGAIDGSTDWSGILPGIDVVVHAAAHVHVSHEPPDDALGLHRRINTEGTLQLARQAAAAGVKRMVFLSTIGVHGTGQERPYKETDTPAPHSPYARSKLDAENGLLALSGYTGMEVVIIRPPLVYGHNAPGNFTRLAAIMRRGLPLPLGCVHNLRSLVAIDNLADFIINRGMTHPAAANQVFLVSDGQDLSTPDLVRHMAVRLNQPARLVPVPLSLLRWGAACVGQQGVLRQLTSTLQADITKARTLLAWEPPLTLDTGLARALSPH